MSLTSSQRRKQIRREYKNRLQGARARRRDELLAGIKQRATLSPTALRRIGIGAAAAALAFIVFYGLDSAANAGKVHRGVYAGGLYLGGYSLPEAEALLRKESPRLKGPVTIVYRNESWRAYPGAFDFKADLHGTAEAAYSAARQGSIFAQAWQRFSTWFRPLTVRPVHTLSKAKLANFVGDIATEVDKTPQDAWLSISGDEVRVTPSIEGFSVRRALTKRLVTDGLVSFADRRMTLPVGVAKVDVTEDGALHAFGDAKRMLSGPISLVYRKHKWTMAAHLVGRFIESRKVRAPKDYVKSPMVLKAGINREKFGQYVRRLTKPFSDPPRNARFATNGPKVQIVPSRDGKSVDETSAFVEMSRVVLGKAPRRVALDIRLMRPMRTTEDAKAMGIRERVSGFTTYYDSGNIPRVTNIQLVARRLDGALVPPGKVFSFNRRVGQRTADKGFQEAPQIQNGQLVPAIGGGACQVSTTLFNAIFFGGYPVLERQPHSLYISHYPDGRDAAVSWPSPNLEFRNDTKAWILIRAWTDSDSISFIFYSTDFGRKVTYRTGKFHSFTPFPTKYIDDPTLEAGKKPVMTRGQVGKSITVWRVVSQNGKVIRRDTFVSNYQPGLEIVRRGTKPKPVPKPTPKPPAHKPSTSTPSSTGSAG